MLVKMELILYKHDFPIAMIGSRLLQLVDVRGKVSQSSNFQYPIILVYGYDVCRRIGWSCRSFIVEVCGISF